MAERGYRPFVVIRPENEASQSLYKKLSFGKLYQTVRMTFTPFTWQDTESETSHILRDNIENAVRQLTIEQKVVDAFRNEEEASVNEEIVIEEIVVEESIQDSKKNVGVVVEESDEQTEKCKNLQEEEVEEVSQERIEVAELPDEENADEAAGGAEGEVKAEETSANVGGTSNDGGSNQDDGGTEAGNSE